MKRILSWLSPTASGTLVYMLQQFEYDASKFAVWMLHYPDLFAARKRGAFIPTVRARFMRALAYAIYGGWLAGAVLAAYKLSTVYILVGLIAAPAVAFVLLAVSIIMQMTVVSPKQRSEITRAIQNLGQSPAVKIAVLGSYGKTSMKELLLTVLSEGKYVAATPGNKNVLISHARWVNTKLDGKEDVLIFEYGEAAPGDIYRFADFSKPDYAVVTGLAPAHLDYYPSLEAVATDFAAIREFVDDQSTWCNDASDLLQKNFPGAVFYGSHGTRDVRVSDINISFSGTAFTLQIGKKKLKLTSGLLGTHHIGPLVAVVLIAQKLGLSDKQIIAGVAKTEPYEHRMQPRHLQGAWIIDDTYNGNIEGMKAGLALLSVLPAKRRIYVTPGLVDQGAETQRVHQELGRLIAEAAPDKVVLMQNSVITFIQAGLTEGEFKGELQVETDPLGYYSGLDHHIAAGDVVMLQNDWPDAYA